MKYLLTLFLLLVSCQEPPDSANALALTEQSFNRPKEVGTLPDGRVVKVIHRNMGGFPTHFIYFVDGVTTTNYSVQQGKSYYNHVDVMIEGVKYIPAEKTE